MTSAAGGTTGIKFKFIEQGRRKMENTEYKIEKGVPLIRPRGSYPFGEMEVGDSFAISSAQRKNVSAAAAAYGKSHGRKYAVRKSVIGARCWRIK